MGVEDDLSRLNAQARSSSGPTLHYVWEHLRNYVVDLVFPPSCAGCGRVGYVWCSRCAAEVALIRPRLSLPHPDSLAGAAAVGAHTGKLQDAVHALKYENVRSMAVPLAQRMVMTVQALGWSPDALIPVPIGQARLRERGYNQAELIALALGHALELPVETGLLWRTRETRTQVGLGAEERRQNVAGAFEAHPTYAAGKRLLLIDDVYTTGATLGACADALINSGASAVYALTVTVALTQQRT